MSQMDEIKNTAREIVLGLRKLGPNRIVALSVHVTKELVTELEDKANQLVAALDSFDPK